MAPQISISTATFNRLQKYAVPLVDDIESVINKLIDEKEANTSTALVPVASQPGHGDARDFSGKVPDLTHTKMLSAHLDGKLLPPSKTNWNRLLDEVILLAASKVKDPRALKQLIIVNCVTGKKEDQGYRYLSKAGISVQGQDSAAAWEAISHILNNIQVAAEVVFMWYKNEKAAHPGQTGKLAVK